MGGGWFRLQRTNFVPMPRDRYIALEVYRSVGRGACYRGCISLGLSGAGAKRERER